jgi:hypothetical protein
MTGYPRIANQARRALMTLAQIADAIAIELGRLNRARLVPGELASMQPRERRRAVRSALVAHHRDRARCC